jgi:hypothetical protein
MSPLQSTRKHKNFTSDAAKLGEIRLNKEKPELQDAIKKGFGNPMTWWKTFDAFKVGLSITGSLKVQNLQTL